MARRRVREAPPSVARQLVKKLPKLSPLLREGYRSLWTDEQCDAWAKKAKPAEVLEQAHAWLRALSTAGDDAPCTPHRLAWLAELTVQLEDALAGKPKAEAQGSRAEAQRLKARLHSRMLLLVGGAEDRGAAVAIANKADLVETLDAMGALLAQWRGEARIRVLADELGLDEVLLEQVERVARRLEEEQRPSPPPRPVEGRLVRELDALERAMSAARAEGARLPASPVSRSKKPEKVRARG